MWQEHGDGRDNDNQSSSSSSHESYSSPLGFCVAWATAPFFEDSFPFSTLGEDELSSGIALGTTADASPVLLFTVALCCGRSGASKQENRPLLAETQIYSQLQLYRQLYELTYNCIDKYTAVYNYIPHYHGNRRLRNFISTKIPVLLSWPVQYSPYHTGQILISYRSTMTLQLSLRNSKQVNKWICSYQWEQACCKQRMSNE